MADAKRGNDGMLGSYRLGRQHESKGQDMEDLGRLYEAHNLDTGDPALLMLPGPNASGEPEEDWSVRVTARARPPYVAVDVEQAPATAGPEALAELFAVLHRMVERMEWSEEMRRRVTRQPRARVKGWAAGAVGVSVAVLLLSLMVVHGWTSIESQRGGQHEVGGVAARAAQESGAPTLVATGEVDTAVIAYPLPAKPFSDQAKAPCHPNLDEVEINGGCWVTLERRPPCRDNQAEYQGKCYLPVAARSRTPRSLQP